MWFIHNISRVLLPITTTSHHGLTCHHLRMLSLNVQLPYQCTQLSNRVCWGLHRGMENAVRDTKCGSTRLETKTFLSIPFGCIPYGSIYEIVSVRLLLLFIHWQGSFFLLAKLYFDTHPHYVRPNCTTLSSFGLELIERKQRVNTTFEIQTDALNAHGELLAVSCKSWF